MHAQNAVVTTEVTSLCVSFVVAVPDNDSNMSSPWIINRHHNTRINVVNDGCNSCRGYK